MNNENGQTEQNYEKYWALTVEYSDINGSQFSNTLEVILRFIDENPSLEEEYDSQLYSELQERLDSIYQKNDLASIRKSINQFVKLGFISPNLKGYREEAKQFIRAQSNEERDLLFSEVYYKYASFTSSITRDRTDIKQINFLLKTLMFHPEQKLTKEEIIGLMTVDIVMFQNGYLNQAELNSAKQMSLVTNFGERKYNQINYFMNFLKYIPGLHISKNNSGISYVEDDYVLIKEELRLTRDPILYRIMREKVINESLQIYGDIVCYLTKKPQKGLVASHIWPSQEALDNGDVYSAYNPNNILLLEPNVDAYFDKFDLTFDKNKGVPFFGTNVYDHFKTDHENMIIDGTLLNEERKGYLDIHNQYFTNKNPI